MLTLLPIQDLTVGDAVESAFAASAVKPIAPDPTVVSVEALLVSSASSASPPTLPALVPTVPPSTCVSTWPWIVAVACRSTPLPRSAPAPPSDCAFAVAPRFAVIEIAVPVLWIFVCEPRNASSIESGSSPSVAVALELATATPAENARLRSFTVTDRVASVRTVSDEASVSSPSKDAWLPP